MALYLVKSWYKWTKTDWEKPEYERRIIRNARARARGCEPESKRLLLHKRHQTYDINGSSSSPYQWKHITLMVRKVHAYDLLHDFNLLGLTFYDLLFYYYSLCAFFTGSLRRPDITVQYFFLFCFFRHQVKLVFYCVKCSERLVWTPAHTPHTGTTFMHRPNNGKIIFFTLLKNKIEHEMKHTHTKCVATYMVGCRVWTVPIKWQQQHKNYYTFATHWSKRTISFSFIVFSVCMRD